MAALKIFGYGTDEYRKALALRHKVLRQPLGLTFTEAELSKDKGDTHIGLFEEENIVACLTLCPSENGKMKMRQVAVDDEQQRKGYGRKLSIAAEEYALKNNCHTLFCHARKTAVPFYQKLGYQIVSDEFTEVTVPHYVMEKKLVNNES
ncbi:MAG: GNAT family N-acetyltransferase [Chitinophagales bacterium]|nr:GNAT family N-acetyltransferase [Chitinophagales bacterium]